MNKSVDRGNAFLGQRNSIVSNSKQDVVMTNFDPNDSFIFKESPTRIENDCHDKRVNFGSPSVKSRESRFRNR